MLKQLETLKSEFLSTYSFIAKIDTPVCLVSEVINNPYEWGFWVKIICICVYGQNLGEKLPDYVSSKELIRGLNRDTEITVGELINDCRRSLSISTGRKLAKRLLRAVYSLTLDQEEHWEDDFVRSCEICLGYFPEWKESLMILNNCYSGWDIQNTHFLEHAEKLFQFVMVRACLSITNIQDDIESIPLVSQWAYKQFINGNILDLSLEEFTRIVRKRHKDSLPMNFIAKAGSEPIGTVSLFERDLNERPELTPWLGSLLVHEKWRSLGVGQNLIDFITKRSIELGYETLYLRTDLRLL